MPLTFPRLRLISWLAGCNFQSFPQLPSSTGAAGEGAERRGKVAAATAAGIRWPSRRRRGEPVPCAAGGAGRRGAAAAGEGLRAAIAACGDARRFTKNSRSARLGSAGGWGGGGRPPGCAAPRSPPRPLGAERAGPGRGGDSAEGVVAGPGRGAGRLPGRLLRARNPKGCGCPGPAARGGRGQAALRAQRRPEGAARRGGRRCPRRRLSPACPRHLGALRVPVAAGARPCPAAAGGRAGGRKGSAARLEDGARLPAGPGRAWPRPRGAFTASPRGLAGGRLRGSRRVTSRPSPAFPLVTSLSPRGGDAPASRPAPLPAKGEGRWAPPCGPTEERAGGVE